MASFIDEIDARTPPTDTPAPDALAVDALTTETAAVDTSIIEEIDILSEESDIDIILTNFKNDIHARTLPADTPAPDTLAIHACATETTAANTTSIIEEIDLLSGESDTLSECDVDIILANFRDDIDARTLPADTPAPDALAIHASATETTAADTTSIIEEIDLLSESDEDMVQDNAEAVQGSMEADVDEEAQARMNLEAVVEWLSDQLIEFYMCSKDCHRMIEANHPEPKGKHRNLYDMYRRYRRGRIPEAIPYVLDSPHFLKKEDDHVPDLNRLWDLFEGEEAQVCLHWYDKVSGGKPTVFFDFDSILAFPTSLAVARLGLSYIPVSANASNLTTDVHLTMKVRYIDEDGDEREKTMPLHKVPHYCIGNFVG